MRDSAAGEIVAAEGGSASGTSDRNPMEIPNSIPNPHKKCRSSGTKPHKKVALQTRHTEEICHIPRENHYWARNGWSSFYIGSTSTNTLLGSAANNAAFAS
jgi:hypothetical protein